MSRSYFVTACAVLVVLAFAVGSVQAKPYVRLLTFETIDGGVGSGRAYSHALDGNTGYFQMSLNGLPRISQVDNINGVPSQSDLVTSAAWTAASGNTSLTTFYGFGLYGSYLQFGDTVSDSIWRVDTGTGGITEYVSKAQVLAHTGLTGASILSPSTADLMGQHVFYEGTSDSILRTTGAGTLETLVSDAELTLAFGNDNVSGGMAMDAAGNLYWGNSSSDAICGRTAAGTLQVVLSVGDITGVTGGTVASFGDVFAAPDGMVYFAENGSDGIMQFDPANPAGTLAYHSTEAELVAGPAGSDSTSTMGWYNGDLTWTTLSTTDGLFNAIPEPATVLLLAGGLLAVALRRKGR